MDKGSRRPKDGKLDCQHCQFGKYVLVGGDKVCDTCYTLAGYRDVGYETSEDSWEAFWRQREQTEGRTRVVGSYQTGGDYD